MKVFVVDFEDSHVLVEDGHGMVGSANNRAPEVTLGERLVQVRVMGRC